MAYPQLDLSIIEAVTKILGDTTEGLTGSEIAEYLSESNIEDIEPTITKWKRLKVALQNKQCYDKCSNNILAFIQNSVIPARHLNNENWFNDTRAKLNQALCFAGYFIREDGKIAKSTKATTINEAKSRANRLKEILSQRNAHSDVFKYCREELLVENYFHTVFEATKSVADKIRLKTNLITDGAQLVDDAFSFKNKVPFLAINSLTTESEQSEQKGFMNLLKGLFGTFRNVTAHTPKINWEITEADALDILSLVSLIHRKLDCAIEARKAYCGNQ